MGNFKEFRFLFTVVMLFGFQAQSRGLLDPKLNRFAHSESLKTVKVLVLLKGQASTVRPRRYDRAGVVHYYKDATRRAALPLLESLQNNQLHGVKIQNQNIYWINGSILAEATPEGLRELQDHPAVSKIYMNDRLGLEPRPHSSLDGATEDYAFSSIGLTQLMKEQPNLTGQGVVVGAVDTGVDGSHPALQGKIPLFYNGETKRAEPESKDFDSQDGHGTHVSGTMVGGDRQHNTIGIAPGAKLVMAGVVAQGYDAMLEGMQWFLDAEKNPVVASKIHAVGCSWNSGGAPDQEVFYRAIAAWEAAGILPVFSAGNSGAKGITPPHEYPGAFAVAAFGANGKVASFSSRGPGNYKGQPTQKPDIAAPGVDITSSVPGGNYVKMSGTSMAQPHVTGSTALLTQVNPNLNPAQIREILLKSASVPEGMTAGQWSPEYGFGKLNIYNAVKMLANHEVNSWSQSLNAISMNGPGNAEWQNFDNLTLGEVDGDVDQFGDTDLSRWIQ